MIKYFLSLSFTLLFFTGCGFEGPRPTKELSQEVKELKPVDKRVIYRAIRDEIDLYNLKGDEAYTLEYNHDALTFYEMVNFYEGYDYIPRTKIEKIKDDIHTKSIYHYNRAVESKDEKVELYELNIVMMNNPDYRDTKELYEKSKLKRKNRIFLNALENSLNMKLLNYEEGLKSISAINKNILKLKKYEFKNKTILKAQELITSRYNKLLLEAIALYDDKQIQSAKKSFLNLSAIYKNDKESKIYLRKIGLIESKKIKLSKASSALIKENYKSAIFYANKVLNLDPRNKRAKEIISESKRLSNTKVDKLLSEGKYNYKQQKLDKAKNLFSLVLTMDANNSTALLYTKKIDRQLKTINSLE